MEERAGERRDVLWGCLGPLPTPPSRGEEETAPQKSAQENNDFMDSIPARRSRHPANCDRPLVAARRLAVVVWNFQACLGRRLGESRNRVIDLPASCVGPPR